MTVESVNERLDGLKNLRDIQGQEGNWDHNIYMTGLYNGLELSLATLEGRDPVLKNTRDVV